VLFAITGIKNRLIYLNYKGKAAIEAVLSSGHYQLTITMFIFNYSVRCFFVIVLLSIIGCKKNKDDQNNNSGGNSDTTANQVNIEGTIYWSNQNRIRSLNLKTNAYIESPVLKYPAGNNYNAPLAFDSGLIYTANRYGASCVDGTTGAIVWERAYASTAYSSSNYSVKNSIVISGNLLYMVGYTGSDGQYALYAIDKKSGVIKWQKATTGLYDYSTLTTPVINGEQIIVLGNNDYMSVDGLNRLICLNRNTGTVIWDKIYNANFGSSLSVKNNILYAYKGDTAAVMAINTIDGTQKWKTPIPAGTFAEKPIFADNELIVHTADRNPSADYYYYLDYNTGLIKGSLAESNAIFGSWAKTDLSYIAAAGLKLTAYDRKDHSVQWQVLAQHVLDQDTIPAAVSWGVTDLLSYKDYVLQFAVWVNPNLSVADQVVIKTIYVTDIKNGKTVQRIKLPKEIPVFNPAFGFILVNQNKPYYTHNSGNVNE